VGSDRIRCHSLQTREREAEEDLSDGVVDQLGQRRRRCEAMRSHHLFVVDQFGLNGPHFYSNGRVRRFCCFRIHPTNGVVRYCFSRLCFLSVSTAVSVFFPLFVFLIGDFFSPFLIPLSMFLLRDLFSFVLLFPFSLVLFLF